MTEQCENCMQLLTLSDRSMESQRLSIDDLCQEQMCTTVNLCSMVMTLLATSCLTFTERCVIMGLMNSLAW